MTATELEQVNRILDRLGIRPLKPTKDRDMARQAAVESPVIVRRGGIGQVVEVR